MTVGSGDGNIKGIHSGSLRNGSGRQEGADGQKHTCTLTFAHMGTHTDTYRRSFDVWMGLLKPSAKLIAFDGPWLRVARSAVSILTIGRGRMGVYSGSCCVGFSINPGKSFENCFDFLTEKDDLFHEPASTLVSKWSSLYSSLGPTV